MSTFEEGWDAAVQVACNKATMLQAGFRGLLKDARARHVASLRAPSAKPEDLATHSRIMNEVSQGEALVGALGDVIRNIAAMKGQYPR